MRGAQHRFQLFRREEWMDSALCAQVDPDLFFADEKRELKKIIKAKLVCRRCPVIDACLSYAFQNDMTDGVWGGTSGRQRKRLRSESRAGNRGLAG